MVDDTKWGLWCNKEVIGFKMNQSPVYQNNRASILHQWINKRTRIHKHPEETYSDIMKGRFLEHKHNLGEGTELINNHPTFKLNHELQDFKRNCNCSKKWKRILKTKNPNTDAKYQMILLLEFWRWQLVLYFLFGYRSLSKCHHFITKLSTPSFSLWEVFIIYISQNSYQGSLSLNHLQGRYVRL